MWVCANEWPFSVGYEFDGEEKFSIKNNCWVCYKSEIMLIEFDAFYWIFPHLSHVFRHCCCSCHIFFCWLDVYVAMSFESFFLQVKFGQKNCFEQRSHKNAESFYDLCSMLSGWVYHSCWYAWAYTACFWTCSLNIWNPLANCTFLPTQLSKHKANEHIKHAQQTGMPAYINIYRICLALRSNWYLFQLFYPSFPLGGMQIMLSPN